MEQLIHIDYSLFHLINHWDNAFLNAIMPYWREKTTWVPVYLIFLIWMIWKHKKAGLIFLLSTALCIGVSDTVSSRIIKKSVKRQRPCRTQELENDVKLLVHCGGGYSFTSSHATNHFALAVFFILTIGRFIKRIKLPLLFWATTIALGQVYVGVHFPLDILAGALLGSLIAWGFAKLYWYLKIPHIYEHY